MWLGLWLSCATPPPECVAVEQLSGWNTVGTAPSGWEYCTTDGMSDRGSFRRVEAVDCTYGVAPRACAMATDLQCPTGQVLAQVGYGCACVQPCVRDADCGSDEICSCAAGIVRGWVRVTTDSDVCVPASCQTGADCGGRDCSLAIDACGGWDALACHADGDACLADDACAQEVNGYCAFKAGEWQCAEQATCD